MRNHASSIASNTMLLFIRIVILTVVNLYALRLVLQGMGQNDYGIFTTIVGTVTMVSIFNGILSLSIQRFFSFSMGQNDIKRQRAIFSACTNITLMLSLIIVLVLETVGLWFINTQLNIPEDRMATVQWIYQFSIVIYLCSLLQIPYAAAIFSHEHMGIYAFISAIDCFLRLIAAYIITIAAIDRLFVYSSGLMITAIIILLLYIIIARHKYTLCRYEKITDTKLYKELLTFSGWTMFGSIANTGMMQGNTLMLNIFFGPIVTASFGISIQIYNAFNSLCNSIVLAFRPPMIKSYAEGDYDYLDHLFYASNKFLLYILTAVALPLICEMDVVLNIWLGETGTESILFARLIVVYLVCMAMHNPITIIVHATGNIRYYHAFVESFTLMCLPLTWCLFRLNLPAYFVFYSMISVCLMAHIIRIICLKSVYKRFSFLQYMRQLILPASLVLLLSTCLSYYLISFFDNPTKQLLSIFIVSPLSVLMASYCIGINQQERLFLHQLVMSALRKTINNKPINKSR